MKSALERELDEKWPLPDIPCCTPPTATALRLGYEQSRIQWRKDHPIIEVKPHVEKCSANPDGGHEIGWDWKNKPICKHCFMPWIKP